MSYAVSGRLLLTESFRLFSDEVLHDLNRLFPFHATPLSARPLDAFVNERPSVFDFPISPDWHQLVLYNGTEDQRVFKVALGGDTAFGGMGLEAARGYYVYDFWNDRFVGRVSGSIEQSLAAGEARMLSVHAVEDHPQWISTDRHLMQGYVDLVEKPHWDGETRTLSGTSRLVGGEPYRMTLVLNGFTPDKAVVEGATARVVSRGDGLADVVLDCRENRDVSWHVRFR